MPDVIKLLVDGGAASSGPPLGPALGPLGLNIGQVVSAINEKTKEFAGMKVPVKLTVDPKTKKFELEIGTPPTSSLILKELELEKGAKEREKVGNLSLAQVIAIADMKKNALQGKDLKGRVLEVIGTCGTMGVHVEGKSSKDMRDEIKKGVHDRVLRGK